MARGRVFLAGDAAHQTPPFAGQGMCAGLRDAANLAWKLDHVLGRPQDATLLETYDLERIPHAAAVIEVATELGKVICIPEVEAAAARDASMAPLVPPGGSTPAPPMPGLSGGMLGLGPHAGELFVQGPVRLGYAEGRFDDVVGAGWHLVLAGATAQVAEEDAAWFRSVGGRIVAMGADVEDLGGCYGRWFDEHRVAAVLQRPDFYLYGTAATDVEVAGLLADVRAHFEQLRTSPSTDGSEPDLASTSGGAS